MLTTSLTNTLVLPSDARFDQARSAFNVLLDQRPEAVALPRTEQDVVAAVDHARSAGLRIAPQATAHNQGPLGDLDGTLLLNVSGLQDIRFDIANRRVRVGAGVKWDRVAPRLSAHGLAGLHGSSPDVGIAGYSLGGGMGWLARKYGLQANAVTALELVTAEHGLIRADHDNHADLFWALRGGGGNFGVVTAIEFEVYPVDELYAGAFFFPFEQSGEVLHAWQALLPTFPEELMSWASMLHFPPLPEVPSYARGRSMAVVMAAFLGDEAEGRELLAPLRALGPVRDSFAMVPPVVLGDLAMDPYDPLPIHSVSALINKVPVEDVMRAVGPDSGRGPAVVMTQFRHMGGALAREKPGSGVRATLPGEVSLFALGVVMDDSGVVHDALEDLEATVRPYAAGHYMNFVEEPADASGFYSPESWARLREIKAAYDPADLFVGNHHIPPAA